MGATPTYAFPFPAVSDSPNGPAQIQALAEALEAKIAAMDALAATLSARGKGFLGEHKPGAPVTTGIATETVLCSVVTEALATGRKIEAKWHGDMSTSTADPGTQIIIKLRYKAGSTVDTSGTVFGLRDMKAGSGTNVQSNIFGTFLTPTSGPFTIVVTATPLVGTATQAQNATEHQPHLLVKEI
jgi:hypothetical protein